LWREQWTFFQETSCGNTEVERSVSHHVSRRESCTHAERCGPAGNGQSGPLQKVTEFSGFNKDNAPTEEHDFLKFELCNREFIFSITYYDKQLEHGSPDPSDPNVTIRIGTLVQAHDWILSPLRGAFSLENANEYKKGGQHCDGQSQIFRKPH
jgi:hypothetical protein